MRRRIPWIMLVLTAIAILNPLGLEIVSAALRYSVTDWLRDLWVTITLAGAAVALVLGLIEWRIRTRIAARPTHQQSSGGTLNV